MHLHLVPLFLFLYLLGEKLRLGAEVKSLRARVRQLEDELSQGVEEEESEEREVEEG